MFACVPTRALGGTALAKISQDLLRPSSNLLLRSQGELTQCTGSLASMSAVKQKTAANTVGWKLLSASMSEELATVTNGH